MRIGALPLASPGVSGSADAASIHWGGQHELDHDGRTLNVRVVAVEGISVGDLGEGYVAQEGEFRTVRIDVNSANVIGVKPR